MKMTSEADASKRDETAYVDEHDCDSAFGKVDNEVVRQITHIHFVDGSERTVEGGSFIDNALDTITWGDTKFVHLNEDVVVNMDNVTYTEVLYEW